LNKVLRRLGASVLIVLAAIAAGTIVPRPLFSPAMPAADDAASAVLLISNPIHTDIAIPLTSATREIFGFLEHSGIQVSAPEAEWLVVGWGGRAFYLETPTWTDLKPMPVLKALTVDRSVLRVDLAGPIDLAHPAVSAFAVDSEGAKRLVDFVRQSFVREGGAVVAIADAGYGSSDRFFEAEGSFNILLGCNTWTARALREAGLRTGLWNPLPQTLAVSLEMFNAQPATASRVPED